MSTKSLAVVVDNESFGLRACPKPEKMGFGGSIGIGDGDGETLVVA